MDMRKKGRGFTIIEVSMFFAVTGMLMLGVLGTASVGINTQRYNDAVNSFSAAIQQEFTKTSNVVNSEASGSVCDTTQPRGTSDCVIIGRLVTVKTDGAIVSSNLIGKEDTAALENDALSELQVIKAYNPEIDTGLQEKGVMNWETGIEKGSPPQRSDTSILIVRSPRSGNLYSYVIHSKLIDGDSQLINEITALIADATIPNSRDQYMCVDRSGWVVSATRAIKIAPFSSGPNGVSIVNVEGNECD